MGHSFGSHLGMLFARRRPDLLSACVGVGQVVDEEEALRIQRRFILERARELGRGEEAAADLEARARRGGAKRFDCPLSGVPMP